VVLADQDELTTAEFPQIAAQVEGYEVRIPPAPPPVAGDPAASAASRPSHLEARDPHLLRLINDNGDVRMLEEIEAETIRFALVHYRGQMSQMARKLGIGRSTLYRKMKDIGIADDIVGDAAA
jgi:DNA-binding NtrC family response regulator